MSDKKYVNYFKSFKGKVTIEERKPKPKSKSLTCRVFNLRECEWKIWYRYKKTQIKIKHDSNDTQTIYKIPGTKYAVWISVSEVRQIVYFEISTDDKDDKISKILDVNTFKLAVEELAAKANELAKEADKLAKEAPGLATKAAAWRAEAEKNFNGAIGVRRRADTSSTLAYATEAAEQSKKDKISTAQLAADWARILPKLLRRAGVEDTDAKNAASITDAKNAASMKAYYKRIYNI